ncbi:hypothetical protein LSH36_516g01009 [Paralvinella palmiformis]|uniref:Reverse transcriptase domain-containing protein n=1 Tax=Paralvinella palmiformis TaxID=53620 RepID=A0AAD9J8D1_9ANNE|nr:hypothetical protein LSH36_516g01009 [Paralvinella palmiformis]
MQSAYKSGHSTETALLRLKNDMLMAIDGRKAVILVLLDLSAAFDTIDHEIICSRLERLLGLSGKSLAWFRSYLAARTQCVSVEEALSEGLCLLFGVPQGSVLGPILFIIYTMPLSRIAQRYGIQIHIKHSSDFQLQIDNNWISPSDSAKNLGILFDQHLNMETHVAGICKASYFHIHTHDALISVVHAFITSRLDYYNSLLLGLSNKMLQRLQRIPNIAARIVTGCRKYDHITPILKELHWLPVIKRIQFKTLMIPYKALNGLALIYLTELLHEKANTRTLRSSGELILAVPKYKLQTYGLEPQGVKCGDLFMSFKSIFQDVRNAVDWVHMKGIGHQPYNLGESIITSRLDYHNSLLYNIASKDILKLHCLQNSLATVVTWSPRFSHPVPLLKSLHWLPTQSDMVSKLCSIAYQTLLEKLYGTEDDELWDEHHDKSGSDEEGDEMYDDMLTREQIQQIFNEGFE